MQRIHFSAESRTVDKTSNQAFFLLVQSKPETVNRKIPHFGNKIAESLHMTVEGHTSYV